MMQCAGSEKRSVQQTLIWVSQVLRTCGVPEDDAAIAASRLVRADMRGIRTHGLALLTAYVDSIRDGHTNPAPELRIEDNGDYMVADADNALGQVAMPRILERAIAASADRALVAVSVRRIGHLGAIGPLVVDVADAGRIGLLIQNTQPLIGLEGSSSPAVGNNPFAFAVPIAGQAPLVFDAAMSAVSLSRIKQFAMAGQPIPADWALDQSGRPTTDPAKAEILQPFGGYKGIALAMFFEALAGSLSDMRPERIGGIPIGNGAFILIVNPDRFLPRQKFDAHVAGWVATYVGSTASARVPGAQASAFRSRQERPRNPGSAYVGTRPAGRPARHIETLSEGVASVCFLERRPVDVGGFFYGCSRG